MVFWRLTAVEIFTGLGSLRSSFVVALIVSIGMVNVARVSLQRFPVLYAVRHGVVPLAPRRKSAVRAASVAGPTRPPVPQVGTAHGTPGGGLTQAGFTAGTTRSGQQGEQRFHEALVAAGLAPRLHSFWSTRLPRESSFVPELDYTGDMDCVLYHQNTVWLIDVKAWSPKIRMEVRHGRVRSVDKQTGALVRDFGPVKHNMARYRERYALLGGIYGFTVRSAYVIMPMGRDTAEADRSMDAAYGSPHYTLDEMIQWLAKEVTGPVGGDPYVYAGLSGLVKR